MQKLLLNHFLSVTLQDKNGKKTNIDLPLELFEDRINELIDGEIDCNEKLSDQDEYNPVALKLTGGIGREVLINTKEYIEF